MGEEDGVRFKKRRGKWCGNIRKELKNEVEEREGENSEVKYEKEKRRERKETREEKKRQNKKENKIKKKKKKKRTTPPKK